VNLGGCLEDFQTKQPVLDTTCVGPSFTARAACDMSTRTLELSKTLSPVQMSVMFGDRYEVVGLPPGTAVTVQFVVDVVGRVRTQDCIEPGCHGTVSAIVFDEFFEYSVYRITAAEGSESSMSESYGLPIRFVVGEAKSYVFALLIGGRPAGNHEGEVRGSLRFTGLPAGARLVSCLSDAPVPVSPTTWGRVKAIYR
jgi:hypothetical protein